MYTGPEEAASIMVAPYPLPDERFANPAAETDMTAVKAAIHAGRSLRSSYGIVPSVSVKPTLRCNTLRMIISAAIAIAMAISIAIATF